MTLASSSKLSLERWSHLSAGPPLVRFACPSADISCARPLPGASSLRFDAATCRTRSARVVSHHLDGLLRTQVRGLVASRSRPGFVAFWKRRSRSRPKTVADLRASSPRRGFTPFEECPRRQQVPHHCGPLPSCRFRRSSDHHRGRSSGESRSWRTRSRGVEDPAEAESATRWHGPSSRVR